FGIDEPQSSLAAREEGGRDLLEVPGDGVEGCREAPLDSRRELDAQRIELLETPLEILALHLQVRQSLLFGLVLLACERIDLAERDAPRLEPLGARRELITVVAFGRLDVTRGLKAPRRVARLGVDACDLDLGRGERSGCLVELLAEADLRRSEPAELLAELSCPGRASVDPGS